MLTTNEAAKLVGKSASWLNKSRMTGSGPVYFKVGGGVRYALPDLNVWLSDQRRTAVYDFVNDNVRSEKASA